MSAGDNVTVNPTRVLERGPCSAEWPEPNTSSSPQSAPQAIHQRRADMSAVLQQGIPSPTHPCGTMSDRLGVVPASVWRLDARRPVNMLILPHKVLAPAIPPLPFVNPRRPGLYAMRRLKRIECPSVGPRSLGNATRHGTSRTNSLKSHPNST